MDIQKLLADLHAARLKADGLRPLIDRFLGTLALAPFVGKYLAPVQLGIAGLVAAVDALDDALNHPKLVAALAAAAAP